MFGEFDGRCLDLFCDAECYDIAIIKPLNVFTFFFMTLMYIKKSIGPRTELYDTPDVTYMMSYRAI